MTKLKLPGRLGDPASTFATDPRSHPRIVDALAQPGGFQPFVTALSLESSYEDCLEFVATLEQSQAELVPQLLAVMPDFETVATRTETISGVDGNDIKLYIDEPNGRAGDLPCILHTHGGGMVFASAEDPTFVRWRKSLAALGLVVIGVEFRNGGGELGNHPFPAGLNDCASAAKWVHANRAALGISSVVISGESGGGNLCIATALKAKQEGWLECIDGVFSMAPMISGTYADPAPELLSLTEVNGYMGDCASMCAMMKVYDPELKHLTNPLAWPYHASDSDLAGLPPHIISVYELDPIRDEGLAYARKLAGAGVATVARTINGAPHCADMIFPDLMPELFREATWSIYGFAKSLVNG